MIRMRTILLVIMMMNDGLDFKVRLLSIIIYDTIQCHIIFTAKLAFGKSVPVETIPTTGISKVDRNLTTTYRNLTDCRNSMIIRFLRSRR